MSYARQVAPQVAGVLCSVVHIWRELKERKSNTSFLVLLLVMQHCPPLPSHPQLFVPLTPHTSSASLNENTGGRAVSAHAALPQLVHQPGDAVPGQMLEAFSCAGAREQVGN